MLAGRDFAADRVAGLDAGADDYLVKPFSFEELTARIRALIRRGAVARPTELQVSDLRLDPASRRAWRGKVELELTTKEFALLRLFLSNPGVVLSRAQILEHVWDYASTNASNVVDQYVLHLRCKTERPLRIQQLETVRGDGYRLREQPIRDTTVRTVQRLEMTASSSPVIGWADRARKISVECR
jgi:two-component system OmpR family response regulator